MSGIAPKVFIKVDSKAEQQETLSKCRKTLKVLQKPALDKENVIDRPLIGKGLTKAKSDDFGTSELVKRKRVAAKGSQTESPQEADEKDITEEDLTTEGNPSENYWELLAKKRRDALQEALDENRQLHERIENLEHELFAARDMLKETEHLVEILKEIVNDNEEKEYKRKMGHSQEEIEEGELRSEENSTSTDD